MKRDLPFVFRVIKTTFSNGRLTYPVNYRIPSIDEIYDEETGRNRLIRYVLGEQSIYADEQTSRKPVLADIVFQNGILTVSPQQVTLKEFLTASNYNEAKQKRMPGKTALYSLMDSAKKAKRDLASVELQADALSLTKDLSPQQILGYAKLLGINTDMSMYEIKHDLMAFAKTNSAKMLQMLNDPKVERMQVIIDAIEYEIIAINHQPTEINWIMGDKRPVITYVPLGMDKIEHLAEFTFDKEGEAVYKEIKKRINISLGIEEKVEEPVVEEPKLEKETVVEKPKFKSKKK